MKALVIKGHGGLEVFEFQDIPIPTPKANEVLVKVKAVSINPVDVKTRKGKGIAGRLKSENPVVLGWDISGEVTEVGGEAGKFKVGDKVFGMVNFPGHGKAYAEFVAAPEDQLTKKPANISHEEAAAATLAALTAWQAIVDNARVQSGQKVLIHAASGGVGHYAVQIAKHLGAYVTGTSSGKNKSFVLGMGADEHIDYTIENFEDIKENQDFVLDAIGGDNIDKSLQVIRPGGTLISIPSGLNEHVTEKAKANNINGYFILVESNGNDMDKIAGLLEDGTLKSHIHKVFDFDEMELAHSQIESGRTVGKVIVTISK